MLGNLFSDFFFHLDKQSLSFLIHTRARIQNTQRAHKPRQRVHVSCFMVLISAWRKNSRFGPCHVLRQLRATDRQKKVQTVAWATAAPRDGFLSSLHTACKQEDQRQTYVVNVLMLRGQPVLSVETGGKKYPPALCFFFLSLF